ncbi:ESX secretion-associated protein EspG [Saccharopolyspora erythraea]|uniref:ESX secretion-associated protein EspG n=1 Tax=Saccharopolyspora erythraea TaxID=1836 RepID=UPI001BABE6F4|nr:ESX secretion-associated protein EspG [Saccharopolyspora erythraea]QUH00139.1 ESX secretion-associated protein EspG [Saccharopolyspora erythraea]
MVTRIDSIIDRAVTLDYPAFDVLYAGECGEDAPKPAGLEGASPGATYRERVRLVGRVLADLRERGLAVVDTPVRPLLTTMRLLCDPHRRIFGWYVARDGHGQAPGSFHIAGSDEYVVFARLQDGVVTIEPIGWSSLYTRAFELLPDVGPVSGGAAAVPLGRRAAREERGGDWLEPVYEEDDDDPVDREHARVQALTYGAKLLFAMQVFTSRKNSRGREEVAGFPLHYYASAHGAVLTVHKRSGPDAEPRLHLIPATRSAFRRELRTL